MPFVLAHTGENHHDLTPNIHDYWNPDPLILLLLLITVLIYGRGVWQLWSRAGMGRGVRRWQVAAFGLAIVGLFAALISPIDAIGAALFSVHMIQHLLLMLLAAPLLALSKPLVPLMWGLPREILLAVGRGLHSCGLHRLWRWLRSPVIAGGLYIGLLWLWHVPFLYEAALQYEIMHILEHASFLGSALLFWWVLLHPSGDKSYGYGRGILMIFGVLLQGSLLSALITFSGEAWYVSHEALTRLWGLTPLEDQQLAGVIMWLPSGIVYLIALVGLVAVWLQHLEKRTAARDQQRRLAQRYSASD